MTENITPAEKDTRAQDREKIIKGLGTLLENHSTESDQEKLQLIVDYITKRDASDFPLFASEQHLSDCLQSLATYDGNAPIMDFIADKLQESMAQHGRYDDYKKYREILIRRYSKRLGYEMLRDNPVFAYGIDKEKGIAHIHLFNPYQITENQTEAGDAMQIIQQFGDGLKQLAEILQKYPDLKWVTALSRLLKQPIYLEFLKGLGFEESEDYPLDVPEEARDPYLKISREDFIANVQKIKSFWRILLNIIKEKKNP